MIEWDARLERLVNPYRVADPFNPAESRAPAAVDVVRH